MKKFSLNKFYQNRYVKKKRNKNLIYRLSSFIILAIFFLGTVLLFVGKDSHSYNQVRVGIIDGYSTDNYRFKITKMNYAKNVTPFSDHANVIWSIISKDIDINTINGFEYNVIEEDGSIDRRKLLQALNKAQKDKVAIINFSGGFYLEDKNIKEKIIELTEKGVVFVAAAGNNPKGMADFPARLDNVISVGSKNNQKISDFSSTEKVDIYAKGEEVTYKGKYFEGTSFAAPEITNRIIVYSINNHVSLSKAKEVILKEGD